MWQQRAELSDLDADALDALSALWLYQAHTPQGDAVADVDELLAVRGLQPKRGGLGRRGGYEPEQRTAMLQAVSRIQNLWLHLTALEVYQYTGISLRRRRREATTELDVQSRVFTITDLLGRTRPDGFMDVERFISAQEKSSRIFSLVPAVKQLCSLPRRCTMTPIGKRGKNGWSGI
jgi:hypothetical protein